MRVSRKQASAGKLGDGRSKSGSRKPTRARKRETTTKDARVLVRSHALGPWFRAIVDEERGLYAVMLVRSSEGQERRMEATDRVEAALRGAASASMDDLHDALWKASAALAEMNEEMQRRIEDPEERSKQRLAGVATLAFRAPEGYNVAHVGWGEVRVMRRGRVALLNRPHMERGADGKPSVTSRLGRLRPEVGRAQLSAEHGDRFLLAMHPVDDDNEKEIVSLLEENDAAAIAKHLGAAITMSHPDMLPRAGGGAAGQVRWSALSSVGMRARNEDAFLVDTQEGIYAIADGMGGHEGGDAASRAAVAAAGEVLRAEGTWVPWEQTARRACELASFHVMRASGYEGGTTLVVARLRDGHAELAHVGDSRAYLLRAGVLRQVTDDHSFVAEQVREGKLTAAEAKVHPQRNVVTKALGRGNAGPPDVQRLELEEGDVLLLCTDGLSGPVADGEIADVILSARSLQDAAEGLVARAYDRGAPDNVTALLLRHGDAGKEARSTCRGNRAT